MILEVGGIAISSAFFAGLIMFLAPCTFPLVPAYLGFISGVSTKDLEDEDTRKKSRRKIFINGLFFVLGFTLIFILFGTVAGIFGVRFAEFQVWLTRIGGILVIAFGFFMLGVFKIPILSKEKRLKIPTFFGIGKPTSSFAIGASFAVGWTPCVGPILAGILLLASTSSTALQGAFLLFIFSLGLSIPFLVIAGTLGTATRYIEKINNYLNVINIIGGIFLIVLGFLLLTNNFSFLTKFAFEHFDFFDEVLLDYL